MSVRPWRRTTTDPLSRWWVWVDETPRPGWLNMAIDLSLLDTAAMSGQPTLRLYQWEPHCLSFGRHEPVLRRYGRERIEALRVDCVRRPTGGRAVWHARELTYAIAAPDAFGPLPAVYDRVHRMLAEAVTALGLKATLAPKGPRTGPGSGPCFATPAGGEVMAGGRKVLGSAQLRVRGALLQHGSLLLEDDQALVHDLAGSRPATPPEAPLRQLLERPVGFREAAEAILQASRRWPVRWVDAPVEQLLAQAQSHTTQFRSASWTWAR